MFTLKNAMLALLGLSLCAPLISCAKKTAVLPPPVIRVDDRPAPPQSSGDAPEVLFELWSQCEQDLKNAINECNCVSTEKTLKN